MEQNCKFSKILYSDTIIVLLMPANLALTDRINTTVLDSSVRVIINMRVFAIAAVLILASSSEARRRPGNGGRPQKQRQPKEDAGTMIRCMAENFGQDDKIQECRDCFKALGKDVMSETNLPKAKECAAQYWPSLSEACADQISEVKLASD